MPSAVVRAPRSPGTFDQREPLKLDFTPLPDIVFATPHAPRRRHHQREAIVIAVPEWSLTLPAPVVRVPRDLRQLPSPVAPRELSATSRIAGNDLAIRAVSSHTSASLEAQVSATVIDAGWSGTHLSGSYAVSTNLAASADTSTGQTSSSVAANARATLKLANRVSRELEVYAKADVEAGANPTLFASSRALTTTSEVGFSATPVPGYGTLTAAVSVRDTIQNRALRPGVGFSFGYATPF